MPTAAKAYAKSGTDMTVILPSRVRYSRPFNFPNWTQMRLGMFFSNVAAADDNGAGVTETVGVATYLDWFTFGINKADKTLPGAAGSLFLGAGHSSDQVSNNNTNTGWMFASWVSALGVYGATRVGGTYSVPAAYSLSGPQYPSPVGADAYAGFFALELIISNRGTAAQTVTMYSALSASVAGHDMSDTALRIAIMNATYAGNRTVAWNDGAAARDIPTCAWVRLPFINNRIRISNLMPIHVVPGA